MYIIQYIVYTIFYYETRLLNNINTSMCKNNCDSRRGSKIFKMVGIIPISYYILINTIWHVFVILIQGPMTLTQGKHIYIKKFCENV